MANPRIEELPDDEPDTKTTKVEDAGSDDESSGSEVGEAGEGGEACMSPIPSLIHGPIQSAGTIQHALHLGHQTDLTPASSFES